MIQRPQVLMVLATLLVTTGGCGSEEIVFPGGSSTSSSGIGGSSTSSSGTGGGTTSSSGTGGGTTSSSGAGGGGGAAPGCGDGVAIPPEPCDGDDLAGQSCQDFGYSAAAGLVCDNCALDPAGCQSTCDGALLEPGEDCDGGDLGGHDCTEHGYSNPGGLVCDNCALDPSACHATCDGALLEPGEDCDGGDLGGHDCTELGYSDPAGLACDGSCALDPTGCQSTCDGALLEPGEDCDGGDLGGHDCTELGYVDPLGLGCDNCALNPAGCTAVCGNQIVEPGEQCDSTPGCVNCQLTGSSCATAIPVTLGLGTALLSGSTVGGGQHQSSQCSGENNTPDRVYAITITAGGFFTAALVRANTDYDSILYALTDCLDPTAGIQCADSWDPINNQTLTGGEVISFEVKPGATIFVVVDGFGGATGNYQLGLAVAAGSCADPALFPLWPGSSMRALGSTTGKPNNTGTQGCGGNVSGEVVYRVVPYFTGNIEASLPNASTTYDAVLSARTTCGDVTSESACDRDPTPTNDELINFPVVQAVDAFTLVDGWAGASGSYRLRLQPQ